jgi:hypothetical protein
MNLRVNKYRNQPTEVDNIRFDSKREAKRYQELRLLERAGVIKDLKLQVRFQLKVQSELICTYVADFVYQENEQQVVEDSKGHRTREYVIKKKLMRAIHEVEILET